MDIKAFRNAFQEFNDTSVYTDESLTLWATLAEAQVGCRWGSQSTMGVYLYVAHEITLGAQRVKAAVAGGNPGSTGGLINTKTVGSVTVGYDTQSTAGKDAAYWNLTGYGQKYWQLVRIFGAGVIQV